MSDREGGASVRFQETKTRTTTDMLGGERGSKHHEGIAHDVGEALTKGAGPNGYLAVRVLNKHSQSLVGLREANKICLL